MGATTASVVEELPENKPMWGKPQRYPKWMAKKYYSMRCTASPSCIRMA
jgi:hypothetical protein